ncbi:hypothetical protein KFL_009500030 [Klebsormidium nitens]|uniref:Uncharacterized protein n=1 Tax=Klebsormidium nitens TaxID=105231 RepID=A0A1Y1IMU6_KLENI|nr:hypothetical protein KFL_009500030 [Klebsormidium nitens]|eukprot:GAQ92225.1 hypothetical protein KFL_009500030 [Klebsormidium nitens]
MENGLLTIPLAQEGVHKALRLLLYGTVIGPAASISLYFAAREARYENMAGAGTTIAYEEDISRTVEGPVPWGGHDRAAFL